MSWEDFKERDDAADNHQAELQKEIDEHADYLISHIPHHSINTFLIDKIGGRCESPGIIDKLFDDDVDFQEWISEVRDELCRRIAVADIEDKYRDRD